MDTLQLKTFVTKIRTIDDEGNTATFFGDNIKAATKFDASIILFMTERGYMKVGDELVEEIPFNQINANDN